jgi:AraC family transcriptional regulator, transcriptional activator of pobA
MHRLNESSEINGLSDMSEELSTQDIIKFDFKAVGIGPLGLAYDDLGTIFSQRGPLMLTPHRHDYYEVIWFTGGKGVHFVEFAAYPYKPNTLFFIAKNQIHAYEQQLKVQGHLLRFDDNFLRPLPEGGLASLEFSVFKPSPTPYRILKATQIAKFSRLLNQIRDELSSPDMYRHGELLSLLLKAFLIETERLAPPEKRFPTERREMLTIFYKFISLLEANYQKHMTVQEYARQLGLPTKRLTEICRSVSGIPTKKIIDERMILEAKRCLVFSSLSIKEICYKLGFDDPAHFSKFFKRATALSPLDFRTSASEMYK